MKFLKPIPFLFLVILFGACSTKSSQKQSDTLTKVVTTTKKIITSNKSFQGFLKKFTLLSLPLRINNTLGIKIDSSKKLNINDNVFIKSEYPDEIYAYGLLPDTDNFYGVIWIEPTEVEVPVLTTFTKDGKKISEEELGVGGCGSDCGFQCSEFIAIKKDLTIFSLDSETSTNCDTNGNLVGKTQKSIRYKTGKVKSNGKFSLSAILEKKLN